MGGISPGPGASAAAVSTLAASVAVLTAATQTIPAPSESMPPATALDGVKGVATEYARADHTHAVRVQRTVITLAQDGTFTWTYARPIAVPAGKKPAIAYMVDTAGSPVVVQVTARGFTSDGTTDTHTSVTVKGQQSRTLPATLLTLGGLVSYDTFGSPAGGLQVNLWAGDPTQ